jgi:hypothetical protein
MFRPVASFIAVFAIINIAASCGNDPYTYRECEVTGDCHQPTQQIPGTICDDDQCRCEDPDQVICCKFGDKRENCPQACRDCLECAEGTPECPTYECHVNEDCADREALCHSTKQCQQGKCVYTPYASRVSEAHQKVGDCAELFCESDGSVVRQADRSDELREDSCTWMECDGIHMLEITAFNGKPCSTGYCVEGRCMECYGSEHCVDAGQSCIRGKCVIAHCIDGVQNVGESDVDCGGDLGHCAGCLDGQRCGGDGDCFSSVCQGQRCVAPTSEDGRTNGTETSRDCGGPSAPPCGVDLPCLFHRDCESGVCLRCMNGSCRDGKVCRAASCEDGTQNQGEIGIDCGGPCTLPCL